VLLLCQQHRNQINQLAIYPIGLVVFHWFFWPHKSPRKTQCTQTIRNRVGLLCNHSALHSAGGLMGILGYWEARWATSRSSNFWRQGHARDWNENGNDSREIIKQNKKLTEYLPTFLAGEANIIDPRCSYLACSFRVQCSDRKRRASNPGRCDLTLNGKMNRRLFGKWGSTHWNYTVVEIVLQNVDTSLKWL